MEVLSGYAAQPGARRLTDGTGFKAVFMDKDGTLIENVHHDADPAKVRLVPGAGELCRELTERAFRIIVVANQPGVTLGLITRRQLLGVRDEIDSRLREFGSALDAFYYCPHNPYGIGMMRPSRCSCHKPRPGLLQRAARRFGISLSSSWMVGDTLDDIESGNRAGCRTILVDNGGETGRRGGDRREPDFVVRELAEAKELIL